MGRIPAAHLVVLILSLGILRAATTTVVTLQGDDGRGEVCRFRAGGKKPFERWLTSQEVTCVRSGSSIVFTRELWNVFGRSDGGISTDPILVDGASPTDVLPVPLTLGSSLAVTLPAGHTGVLYAPKHATAFPVAERNTVPAKEEMWLFVLEKSVPVAVVVIPALDTMSEREVDARNLNASTAVVGWVTLATTDYAALRARAGTMMPQIRIASGGTETVAAALPGAPEVLNGALVLMRGVAGGDAELQFSGRGWLPFRQKIAVGPQAVTLVRSPIVARASATLFVKWDAGGSLPALAASLGSCKLPRTEPPPLVFTISFCAESREPEACVPIRTESPAPTVTSGSVTLEDVRPGFYRAELRCGRLPAIAGSVEVAPLQMQELALEPRYVTVHGTVTRGGQPLGEDAEIQFPGKGVGFATRISNVRDSHAHDSSVYRAILPGPLGTDDKIEISTCRGKHAFVLTDWPIDGGRYDIDIPDNVLTVSVVDTFSRRILDTATVRYLVMSKNEPRVPVVTRVLRPGGGEVREVADQSEEGTEGRFVIKAVPNREIRLQASNPGYKKQDLDPFSISKHEKKEVEIQLAPLTGSEGKIVSRHPFESGMIFWSSPDGVVTERADLADDGTFFFERSHVREETMAVVSLSHPLWVTRAPLAERRRVLVIGFPDAAPLRQAAVRITPSPSPIATLIGVVIGGQRVPGPALAKHLWFRGIEPFLRGTGPLLIPALAETGVIDILRGPSLEPVSAMTMSLYDFAPTATRRLVPGIEKILFDGK